jgi:glutamate synthase (NADPH/NADH) small chain
MAKPTGFIEYQRAKLPARPIEERVHDYRHVYHAYPADELTRQAARCMDCGVPFCHQGCPLGNLIPDWNDLVYRDKWREAFEQLERTNNFPEFTGLLCPAPCEGSCVLGLNRDAVTIKSIELAIVDRGFDEGWIVPQPPVTRTWKKVAVIGSGPAGLAAAAQLNRAGHSVTVFEQADRLGGLLRYGIPEFKLEKRVLARRLELLASEGILFRTGVRVGDDLAISDVRRNFDAVVLACGARQPRDLDVPGRRMTGVHFAMDYLMQQNRRCEGDPIDERESVTAARRHVIIIGGGDTGADCLGTAHRQGAKSVTQLEIMQAPPSQRAPENPWPLWPITLRSSSAHEEGGERAYATRTTALLADSSGRVRALVTADGRELPADLVLLAMGFTGPERNALLERLDIRLTERGTVWRDDRWMTSVPGVFVAGDMQRGQSLIVWAIDDGRRAAASVDAYLKSGYTARREQDGRR